MAAAVSLMAEVRDSVSTTTPLTEAASWADAVETVLAEVVISWAVAVTLWIEAADSSIAAAFSLTEDARLVAFTVTCSIEAAVSVMLDATRSAETAIEAA